ncbi:hypothetical protein Psta_3721 [Pirellula staleyi DSM 6068]|uniref:Tyr recombinase domain-containing protein n=1 Tax=Pirellula staleyi (strain ATCC 27377 / DSM 6068 / ICPB 4128) TaxID=530564 RepID=D2R011_PIRSD|nr:site-specific integrase [Pirellula staleyi]ADB18376.1 hypothetical protein Psta_3721 [Pirellula staleyi DSM 6068]
MSKERQRRRSRGSAWYWKQTDCWYYTAPGSQKRVRLLALDGTPIRGATCRKEAELSLARERTSDRWQCESTEEVTAAWSVGRVCSEYIAECERRLRQGSIGTDYEKEVRRYLNVFAKYCGALPVAHLKRGHLDAWLQNQDKWRSTATQRFAITIVLSAFAHASENFQVKHSLLGFSKPPQRPRLHSISPEDEASFYRAADPCLADFIFAAIHTGLRPFCELARMSTGHLVETPQGMLWKVYSSKTDKTRVVPVSKLVAKRIRQRLQKQGDGPIFRNRQGNAWKKPTAGGLFRLARRTLGWENDPVKGKYSCYSCRHTFAHRMLSGYWNKGAGCSIETLAELMGDTPSVAYDHYGREWGKHYQDPLWAAIGME